MSESTFHPALTPDLMLAIFKEAGHEPELIEGAGGVPILRSVSSGVSFAFYFGNQARTGEGNGYGDGVFQATFAIQGEMPLELLNQWNANRRFARLFLAENTLYLIMDIIAYGGVTDDGARAFVEIWDQLIPETLLFLREELPKHVRSASTAQLNSSP